MDQPLMTNRSDSLGNGTADSAEYHRDASDILVLIYPPFTLTFGTFGNVMTIIVVRAAARRFCGPGVSVFFVALAVWDQIILTLGLGRKWISSILGFDLRNLHPWACKTLTFAVYTGTRNTAWIIVAAMTQRVFAVVRRKSPKRHLSRNSARTFTMILAIVCASVDLEILYRYNLRTEDGGGKRCAPITEKPEDEIYYCVIYSWLTVVTVYFIPSVILVANNVIMTVKLRNLPSRRLVTSHGTREVSMLNARTTSLALTLMLLSLAFIVLHATIPVTAFANLFGLPKPSRLVDEVLTMMLYWYYAVKLYLYTISSPIIRKTTIDVLCGAVDQISHKDRTVPRGRVISVFSPKHPIHGIRTVGHKKRFLLQPLFTSSSFQKFPDVSFFDDEEESSLNQKNLQQAQNHEELPEKETSVHDALSHTRVKHPSASEKSKQKQEAPKRDVHFETKTSAFQNQHSQSALLPKQGSDVDILYLNKSLSHTLSEKSKQTQQSPKRDAHIQEETGTFEDQDSRSELQPPLSIDSEVDSLFPEESLSRTLLPPSATPEQSKQTHEASPKEDAHTQGKTDAFLMQKPHSELQTPQTTQLELNNDVNILDTKKLSRKGLHVEPPLKVENVRWCK